MDKAFCIFLRSGMLCILSHTYVEISKGKGGCKIIRMDFFDRTIFYLSILDVGGHGRI